MRLQLIDVRGLLTAMEGMRLCHTEDTILWQKESYNLLNPSDINADSVVQELCAGIDFSVETQRITDAEWGSGRKEYPIGENRSLSDDVKDWIQQFYIRGVKEAIQAVIAKLKR